MVEPVNQILVILDFALVLHSSRKKILASYYKITPYKLCHTLNLRGNLKNGNGRVGIDSFINIGKAEGAFVLL